MSSGSEQTENSDDENSANDKSDMQHNTQTMLGAETPRFPLSRKLDINVDLEH
jgi:hypothetical protein